MVMMLPTLQRCKAMFDGDHANAQPWKKEMQSAAAKQHDSSSDEFTVATAATEASEYSAASSSQPGDHTWVKNMTPTNNRGLLDDDVDPMEQLHMRIPKVIR
jgi:hypothetical protein